MAQVAILIPLMRAHKIAPLVQNIQETTSDYTIVVLATSECAEACEGLPVRLIDDGGGTFPERINRGFRETTEPVIFTAADDLWFHAGWFEAAMRVMETTQGVVGVEDLHNPSTVHFLISRDYINTYGGYKDAQGIVFFEEIQHCYCDDSVRLTASNRGKFAKASDSVVEHMHVGRGKAPMDEVYRIGEATMSQGYQVFSSHSDLWQ